MADAAVPGGRRVLRLPAITGPLAALEGARGSLFAFTPVLAGIGIAGYFALPTEPSAVLLRLAGVVGLAGLALWRVGAERWQPLGAIVCLVAAGFLLATWRANAVAAPVLDFRYYGPVEGRVVEIDRAASDRLRVTLDRVVLARTDPARVPERVRITLPPDAAAPEPGTRLILTGTLGPPGRPVEPGAFDFRRTAWFEGLGAVGYTQTPVLVLSPAERSADLWLHQLRMRLSAAVMAHVPGDAGAFAAAVTTGDRSGISPAANEAMRGSNLYHLLSISGMHMAMLAGFVFGVVRYGLALVPPLALRLPVRKLAAGVALAASAFYLLLSGRDVATERSFVMVAVMLGAVLADRRAISMRSVAIAALIVLGLRPESLLNPGFQMSFAATVALVAAFGWLNRIRKPWPGWADPVMVTLISSAVAGWATAPFAAAHFNRMADYGLAANLLAAPAMGLLVMPGGVLALCLAPFGLAGPPLWLAGMGARWILFVAGVVSGLDGAVRMASTPPGAVVPLIGLGGLWVVLWPGRARWLGLVALAGAGVLWVQAERPALLISESGGLSGQMTEHGRVLSKPKGDAFAATRWLSADGDALALLTEGAQAAGTREGMERTPGRARYSLAGWEVAHLTGKGAAEAAATECRPGRIVVANVRVPAEEQAGCTLIDARFLAQAGAVALHPEGEGLRIETAAKRAGRRLWTASGRGEAEGSGDAPEAAGQPPRRTGESSIRQTGG